MTGWGRLVRVCIALFAVVCVVVVWGVGSAWAVEPGTGWEAFVQAYPTDLHPGGRGTIQIDLVNTGAKPSSGPITVTDTLPKGLITTAAGGMIPEGNAVEVGGLRWSCKGVGTEEVTCTSDPLLLKELPFGAGDEGGTKLQEVERVGVAVEVGGGVPEGAVSNQVTVAGGGAVGVASVRDRVVVGSSEPGFGFSGWDVWFSNADGTADTQAGSHPYETSFALGFNELADGELAGEPRNLEVELPPGFFGEPNAVPRCARAQLDGGECPADTQLGNVLIARAEAGGGGPGGFPIRLPVYNMVPPPHVAAEFAFKEGGKAAYLDGGPSGYGGYRLVTHIDDVPALEVDATIVTLWGVASEASHDAARLTHGPSNVDTEECQREGCPSSVPARPFLTLPTSCTEEPQPFTIRAQGTWLDPAAKAEAVSLSHNAHDVPGGFTGCSALSFNPSISVAPDTSEADTPAGLGVDVTMPQETLRSPGTLTEATIKNASVTLPAGFVINPGQAAGLQACQRGDVEGGDDLPVLHKEGEEEEARGGEAFDGPAKCPSASRVGTVRIKTPLLEGELESELEGSVYVLTQSNGGPGEPPNLQSHPPAVQLLLAASGDGINIKLEANVQLNEANGQLTTTLTETPALPVTSVEVAFNGGPQAALATPAACGAYTTTSDFTPWTSPFATDELPSSSFQITGGPQGSACPSSPLPFHPELTAGSTTDEAGGFTGFSLLLQRGDGQQRIERLQLKMPPGLSGVIGAVEQCLEPQAAAGECSQASEIGTATVASGPGQYPLVIPQPGEPPSRVYLTGPYEGAPFGLSIVTRVITGPFDLEKGTPCDCIVTRAKVEIDPLTTQITITTQPLPQILDGVPTDLRLVNSTIAKQGFLFNPTNCNPSSFTGTAWGTPPPGVGGPGASTPIESRFQVGSCRSLKFKPTFKVSTSAHTSRLRGASLHVTLSLPNQVGQGTETNVQKVKVSLPKQLPTPLKTLQKACTETVFAENPAHCPEASKVGEAKVSTPVLPGGLTGTAYFVSHGGAKYPELIIVLTGENGLTIQIHSETFISKQGITTATFNAAPDQPFTSFELTLPQRQYPALTANGDLCNGTLTMPTEMVGQNGIVIKQATKIAVTGCPKKTTHKKHKSKKHPKNQHKT
jgi:hypothetical protein